MQVRYKGYDDSGSQVSGELKADDLAEAKLQLQRQGILTTDIKQVHAGFTLARRSASRQDLELLIAEISSLLRSGIRIDRALDLLSSVMGSSSVNTILQELREGVRRGEKISDLFARHPHIFDNTFVSLVKIGEETGRLSEVFARLTLGMKQRNALHAKLMAALAYPMVIVALSVLSIYFMMVSIVPQIAPMFEDIKSIPWYTQMLLSASAWLVGHQLLTLLLVLGAIFILAAWARRLSLGGVVDRLANMPGLKNLFQLTDRLRFAQAMSILLESGVALDTAVDLAASSPLANNGRLQVKSAYLRVRQGERLSKALSSCFFLDDFFLAMIAVGEEAGDLKPVFSDISERSASKLEQTTSKLMALIEPLLIILMGGLVGGIVLVMMLSLVSINDIGL